MRSGGLVSVGLISDTHGLLRPEALTALAGCDLIIHAGDIGDPRVLDELARVAPVCAVRGNVDRGDWAEALPERRVVTVGQAAILVIHNVADLAEDPAAAGIAAVVSGHSHQPGQRTRNGVLYVNPGSAGPRRFKLPVAVGILSVAGTEIAAKLVALAVPPPGASKFRGGGRT